MSGNNYRRNRAAINQFRKELEAMFGDIRQIDKKVLNKATNAGVAYAKRKTPVGKHPNPVEFTVKNGPQVGKVVRFSVRTQVEGGFLRKSWKKLPTNVSRAGVETEVINTAEYASYWNYGHRIVTKKGGPTKGFKEGTHVLEKMQTNVERTLVEEFRKEVEAVQREYDR